MNKNDSDYMQIERIWDDYAAEYQYRLVRYTGGTSWEEVATGDSCWAKRQAEHYGIEIITNIFD